MRLLSVLFALALVSIAFGSDAPVKDAQAHQGPLIIVIGAACPPEAPTLWERTKSTASSAGSYMFEKTKAAGSYVGTKASSYATIVGYAVEDGIHAGAMKVAIWTDRRNELAPLLEKKDAVPVKTEVASK